MRLLRIVTLLFLCADAHLPAAGQVTEVQSTEVEQTMAALLDAASGRSSKFHLRTVLQVPIDGFTEDLLVDIYRDGAEFDLSIVSRDNSMIIRRRAEGTALALPKHKVVFLGKGNAPAENHLEFSGLAVRMISSNCSLGRFAPIMLTLDPKVVLKMAQSSMGAKIQDGGKSLSVASMQIRVTRPGQIASSIGGLKMRAGVNDLKNTLQDLQDWPGYQIEEIERSELERTVSCGIRRATEIAMPGDVLKSPQQPDREVENGKLTWIDGQRLVVLRGSPEQIGRAHGQLLGNEVGMCIDSILYTFGLMQTAATGKWFLTELKTFASRQQAFIPQSQRDETDELASTIGQSPSVMEALNAFSDLSRCSGFAVSGSVTTNGKPLLGRLLDRPAAIGLHDCATIFVILPEGKSPFVSLSYAGFTGCISGMNQSQVAISLTGYNGQPTAEGVPAPSLVRTALEECSSLSQITDLWKSAKRCGKYDFLIADGKDSLTLAVTTTPDSLELIRPGGDHAVLGAGITDSLVVSKGERLSLLRSRITKAIDKLQAESALAIMASPVSTGTNLSNILLAPADQNIYIANADYQTPAHEKNYSRVSLRDLFDQK